MDIEMTLRMIEKAIKECEGSEVCAVCGTKPVLDIQRVEWFSSAGWRATTSPYPTDWMAVSVLPPRMLSRTYMVCPACIPKAEEMLKVDFPHRH